MEALPLVMMAVAAAEIAVGAVAVGAGLREAMRGSAPGAGTGPAPDPGAARSGGPRAIVGDESAMEGSRPLLALAAGTLLVLSAAGIPLLFLLLNDMVPRWPGVMCVAGVRRIGAGTLGAARFLPATLAALDATRLALPFAAGAWWVLHRAGGTAIRARAGVAAAVLGALAVLDGGLAATYVLLPREEIATTSGCCSTTARGPGREEGLVAGSVRDATEGSTPAVAPAYVAAAATLAAGAALARRGAPGRRRVAAIVALAAGSTASLPLAWRFLVDVAAPAALALPYHRCAWCAFARAPEVAAGAALHAGGVFAVAWAATAALLVGEDGASPWRALLGAAAVSLAAAAAMGASFAWAP